MNPALTDLAAQTAIVAATSGWALLAAFVAVAIALLAVRAIARAEVQPDPTPCIHPDDQADTELGDLQAAQEDNAARMESWWTT